MIDQSIASLLESLYCDTESIVILHSNTSYIAPIHTLLRHFYNLI